MSKNVISRTDLRAVSIAVAPIIALFFGTIVSAQARPNLVFVLSDDHRHDFLGCAGHPLVQTPTIDRLAASGVRFRHAFVTTSICAASRATLLTGLTERSHAFTFGLSISPAIRSTAKRSSVCGPRRTAACRNKRNFAAR